MKSRPELCALFLLAVAFSPFCYGGSALAEVVFLEEFEAPCVGEPRRTTRYADNKCADDGTRAACYSSSSTAEDASNGTCAINYESFTTFVPTECLFNMTPQTYYECGTCICSNPNIPLYQTMQCSGNSAVLLYDCGVGCVNCKSFVMTLDQCSCQMNRYFSVVCSYTKMGPCNSSSQLYRKSLQPSSHVYFQSWGTSAVADAMIAKQKCVAESSQPSRSGHFRSGKCEFNNATKLYQRFRCAEEVQPLG